MCQQGVRGQGGRDNKKKRAAAGPRVLVNTEGTAVAVGGADDLFSTQEHGLAKGL